VTRPLARPAAVQVFEEALADWLSSFTMPEALAAEMVDACADGAPWAAAIAGVAARRAGWSDPEAMAWGLCVGGVAGALEATGRSLAGGDDEGAATPAGAATAAGEAVAEPAASLLETASGPARPLLAADGLIAAAHEALGSLEPAHARSALAALADAFADGGAWRAVPRGGPRPAWAAMVACALGPARNTEPAGPWAEWAQAWDARYGGAPIEETAPDGDRELWHHDRADASTKTLLRAAAREAAARDIMGRLRR
jgi:hypothetical protein